MVFKYRVVGEFVSCTLLFILPVSPVKISVKFRKVPREKETDEKHG
jgi:hypothetical protein